MIIQQLGAGDDLSGAIDLLCRFFAEEGFEEERERIAKHAKVMAGLAACGESRRRKSGQWLE